MAGSRAAVPLHTKHDSPPPISGNDGIRYTRDMLADLRRIAVGQDHLVLAHLLDAAGREADRLLRDGVN